MVEKGYVHYHGLLGNYNRNRDQNLQRKTRRTSMRIILDFWDHFLAKDFEQSPVKLHQT